MNLLKAIKIKNKSVNVIKKDNYVILENCSNVKGKIFIAVPFKNKLHTLIKSDVQNINGQEIHLKILNSKLKVIKTIKVGTETYFTYNKLFYVAILVPANSTAIIKQLEIKNIGSYDFIYSNFKNELLIISPGYPYDNNKYSFAFVHSRVKKYNEAGIKADIIVSSASTQIDYSLYTFEDIKVCEMSFNLLRLLLLKKRYKKILVHFVENEYLRILESINDSETQIFLFSHGVDLIDQKIIRRTYLDKPPFPEDINDENHNIKKMFLEDFNSKKNVYFIFVSNWQKRRVEKKYKISFERSTVIPNFVDEKLFSNLINPKPELGKNIVSIKPQNNYSQYSVDIIVRTILELSRRPIFNDLTFSIYGSGQEHSWLVAPLLNFKNVHIYDTFLTHEQMKNVFDKNGIFLNPSRYDTMGVSACEAAMCGKVVIASKGNALEEYLNSNKVDTYCNQEDYISFANKIEEFATSANKFKKTSALMHDLAFNTCSSKHSIVKEISLLNSFKAKPNIIIPDLSDNPLLTISVAAYNVEKFIVQLMTHILLCKNANKIELLILNDGSKDGTRALVEDFVKKYYHGKKQPNIKLINKENGGHGSTINTGIKLATGKYFRVLDGDDYLRTRELDRLIEAMENCDADAIATDLVEDDSSTCIFKTQKNYSLSPGVIYNLNDTSFKNYGFTGFYNYGLKLATAHVKTKLLKNSVYKLDEHCFYDDTEFDQLMMLVCKTLCYFPLPIYNYYMTRSGQSTSVQSYKLHFYDQEKVTIRLINEYENAKLEEGIAYNIYNSLVIQICIWHYRNATLFRTSKKFRSFNKKIKIYKKLYKDIAKQSKLVAFYRKFPFLIFANKPITKIYKLTKKLF